MAAAVLPAGLGLAGLVAWHALASGRPALASPVQTAWRLWALLGTVSFQSDIAATAKAFAWSAVLSIAGGLALGLLLGARRLSARVSEPILVSFYALPKVTLYPAVLLVFGLGLDAKVAFGVMHGLVPLALFTMRAVGAVPPILLRTARTLRLTRRQEIVTVILPAIGPDVLAGMRLSTSLSLLGVLVGEMFAASHGIGHRAVTAMESGDMATVLAVAMLLVVVVLSVGLILDKMLMHWSVP